MIIESTNPVVAGKIYKMGGQLSGAPLNWVRRIDLNDVQPSWQNRAPMTTPRVHGNTVLLPNGQIAVIGGMDRNDVLGELDDAIMTAQIYDPPTNTWLAETEPMAFSRMYHSTAAPTPDGAVGTFGGEYKEGGQEKQNINAQLFYPWYLLIDSPRPVVHGVVSGGRAYEIRYDTVATVNVADTNGIANLALLRVSSTTHGIDTTQRYIRLTESGPRGDSQIYVHTPKDGGIAPPGVYMLFAISDAGVPSVAKYVRVY